jgi:hypothetical protein
MPREYERTQDAQGRSEDSQNRAGYQQSPDALRLEALQRIAGEATFQVRTRKGAPEKTRQLGAGARMFLAYVFQRHLRRPAGRCFESRASLSRALGVPEASIRTWERQLAEVGILATRATSQRREYRLAPDVLARIDQAIPAPAEEPEEPTVASGSHRSPEVASGSQPGGFTKPGRWLREASQVASGSHRSRERVEDQRERARAREDSPTEGPEQAVLDGFQALYLERYGARLSEKPRHRATMRRLLALADGDPEQVLARARVAFGRERLVETGVDPDTVERFWDSLVAPISAREVEAKREAERKRRQNAERQVEYLLTKVAELEAGGERASAALQDLNRKLQPKEPLEDVADAIGRVRALADRIRAEQHRQELAA